MSHATYLIYRTENEFIRGLVLQALIFADVQKHAFLRFGNICYANNKKYMNTFMYTSKETYIKFTTYIARNLYYRNLNDIFFFVS